MIPPGSSPMRILVVDDSGVELRLIQATLTQAGYDVTTALDGAEALVRLAESPFDAAVVDGIMPIVDGYELCLIIKDGSLIQPIPVILYTGEQNPANRLWARICGADHFLFKGFSQQPLLEVLAALAGTTGAQAARLERHLKPRTAQELLARQLKRRLMASALHGLVADLYDLIREPKALGEGLCRALADLVLPGGIQVILPLREGRFGFRLWASSVPAKAVLSALDQIGESEDSVAWQQEILPVEASPGEHLAHHWFLLSDPASGAHGWWGVSMPERALQATLHLLNTVDEAFQPIYRTAIMLDQLVTANARLKAADAMKTEFVRTVSHEIRNPLATAQAAVDLLCRGSLTDAKTPRRLQTVQRSIQRILGLANGVLDLEKIEAGEFACAQTEVDVAMLCGNLAEDHQTLAEELGLDLRLELPAEGCVIRGDEGRLSQCIVNLMTNGIKHSPRGGTLRLQLTLGEGCCRIALIDQGAGVPVAFRQRLFQKFQQADPTAGQGTGLGLAVTRALARQMGGDVWHEDNPEGGAVFCLSFPVLDRVDSA